MNVKPIRDGFHRVAPYFLVPSIPTTPSGRTLATDAEHRGQTGRPGPLPFALRRRGRVSFKRKGRPRLVIVLELARQNPP